MRKLGLYLTILISILGSGIFAQTPVQSYEFALKQIQQGNYDVAINSLKRVQYFDTQSQFPQIVNMLGDCYFHIGEYDNAYYYYDLSFAKSDNDSVKANLQISKIACKLYQHEYNEALVELFSFDGEMNSFQSRQMNMLYGITYFYIGNYIQSRSYFGNCLDTIQNSTAYLDSRFKEISRVERRYNPKVARIMSMILPGAGQLYAGDPLNAANSFLLITGLLTGGVALGASLSYIEAAIIVFPWVQRYYSGGFEKAAEIALFRQESAKKQILQEIVRNLNGKNKV